MSKMKNLLLVFISIIFAGCVFKPDMVVVDINDLKFQAGQKVSTTIHFYAKCEGTILGFYDYYNRRNRVRSYYVKFWCPNLGYLEKPVVISETSLKAFE